LKSKRRALGAVLHSTLPALEEAGAPNDAGVLAREADPSVHNY